MSKPKKSALVRRRSGEPESEDGPAVLKALLQRAAAETGRPQRAVHSLVDASVDALNRHVEQADIAREAAAEHLFRVLLGNDADLAFAPESQQPAIYLLVKRRAGLSLDLERSELVTAVKVAAINQLVPEDAWQTMRWSKKKVLVAMVETPSDLRPLRAAVRLAGRLNMGLRPLKAWVEQQNRGEDEPPAPQAGPTLATGRRITRVAEALSSEEREVLVRRVAEAEPEARDELLRAFRKLAKDAADFVRDVERYGT